MSGFLIEPWSRNSHQPTITQAQPIRSRPIGRCKSAGDYFAGEQWRAHLDDDGHATLRPGADTGISRSEAQNGRPAINTGSTPTIMVTHQPVGWIRAGADARHHERNIVQSSWSTMVTVAIVAACPKNVIHCWITSWSRLTVSGPKFTIAPNYAPQLKRASARIVFPLGGVNVILALYT